MICAAVVSAVRSELWRLLAVLVMGLRGRSCEQRHPNPGRQQHPVFAFTSMARAALVCNPNTRTIRLNTELAKKPKECLEYVLAHEMVHLIEPSHGPGFLVLMDRFMPQWRHTRTMLNRLPAKHEDWNCNITD